jgi:stearoyl-CoA desaturase (delta-9 desaturase)
MHSRRSLFREVAVSEATPQPSAALDRPNWAASVPFLAFHLVPLLAFVDGVTWERVGLAIGSYAVLMFAVTAGYHRYFSHRTYKTGRVFQFLLAWVAQMSAQKGVLWWASHHRLHHKRSDMKDDVHSPQHGFWWSHVGWFMSRKHDATNYDAIKDFSRFPELVWLNEWHLVPFLTGLGLSYWLGGLPGLVWGIAIPTVAAWHATFAINSLAHVLGSRRYLTTDTSRNSFVLALLTGGEGWHNNHHYLHNTANQGWFWWEVDFTFYVLKALSVVGVVRDLRVVRKESKEAYLHYTPEQQAQLKDESRPGLKRKPMPSPLQLAEQKFG